MAQLVEHILGKDEVPSSNLGISLKTRRLIERSDALFIFIFDFPHGHIDNPTPKCYNYRRIHADFKKRMFNCTMDNFDTFVYIIEIISITVFGMSGAMVGIKKGMDLFGVIMLGITTSVGGGIIRDFVLGFHPPKSFNRPAYAITAAITALITFIIEYRHHKKNAGSDGVHGTKFTDEVMFWIDSVGLAIYTVVGVAVGYEAGTDNFFVLLFSGVVTGVGGGLLRDVMAQNMPYIFVKHIYASACIVGSIVCIALWDVSGRIIAMLAGCAAIMLLRFFARKYRWNMPRVPFAVLQDDTKK